MNVINWDRLVSQLSHDFLANTAYSALSTVLDRDVEVEVLEDLLDCLLMGAELNR